MTLSIEEIDFEKRRNEKDTGLRRFVRSLAKNTFNGRWEDIQKVEAVPNEGVFMVYIDPESEYHDWGRASGEAFLADGYAIIGVHQHHHDNDTPSAISFKRLDVEHETDPFLPTEKVGERLEEIGL